MEIMIAQENIGFNYRLLQTQPFLFNHKLVIYFANFYSVFSSRRFGKIDIDLTGGFQ